LDQQRPKAASFVVDYLMISHPKSVMPLGADALRWFVPRNEPAQRGFRISTAGEGGRRVEVRKSDLAKWPFCTLSEFTADADKHRILLVAPLSGHFAFILREMVSGLVRNASVSVTDWRNASYVPLSAGEFGFDENIDTIARSIEIIGPGAHVIALCQGTVPALAATALLAEHQPELAPRSLILLGGPVDPLANTTRVVELLRQAPPQWFEQNVLDRVGPSFPGAGRMVYPARHQMSALAAYFCRHWAWGGELFRQILDDDRIDPTNVPFFDLFTSLMDLPAKFFLENIQKVFQDRDIWTGQLEWRNQIVDFSAIRRTALMTIEGAQDDIAAPGQTRAAHWLCPNIPAPMRRTLTVDGAGHFSLFHGRTWREKILQKVNGFIGAHASPPCSVLPRPHRL
jgi:poly(3-hydroxybutyrate) depolymerase